MDDGLWLGEQEDAMSDVLVEPEVTPEIIPEVIPAEPDETIEEPEPSND
jgi:hypothetical protein